MIDLLEADHDRIRTLKEEVRALLAQDLLNEKIIVERLKRLQAFILAHLRGEELALYSLFRHLRSVTGTDLQIFSLEGPEEHQLIEQSFKEILEIRRFDPLTVAKFTESLISLSCHFDEEEQRFFPGIKSTLSGLELAALAEVYARKRDQVFGPLDRQLFMENQRSINM